MNTMRWKAPGRISQRFLQQQTRSIAGRTKSTLLDTLNTYSHAPPTRTDYERAEKYITRGPVSFLFSCSKLLNFPAESTTPEIAFLGRSNVGKSSLLNALLNRKNAKLAHESKHPGRTRTMNLYGVGPAAEGVSGKRVAKQGMSLEMLQQAGEKERKKGSTVKNVIGQGGLVVVDCPGYGYGSRDEWGEVVIRYLQKRKQLARAFLLIDVVAGVTKSDHQILEILRESETPHQIVLSKVDKLLFPSGGLDLIYLQKRISDLHEKRDAIRNEVGDSIVLHPDILMTSSNSKKLGDYTKIGIRDLQFTVCQAAGLTGKGKEIDKIEQGKAKAEYHGVVSWEQLEKMGMGPTAASGEMRHSDLEGHIEDWTVKVPGHLPHAPELPQLASASQFCPASIGGPGPAASHPTQTPERAETPSTSTKAAH